MAAFRRVTRREGTHGFDTYHVKGQPYGEVDPTFTITFFNELGDKWYLIDSDGLRHIVKFNRNKEAPCLTNGWYDLRDSYGLKKNHHIIFRYLKENTFHIAIEKTRNTSTKIFHPWHTQCSRKQPHLIFDLELTGNKANENHLDVPHQIAETLTQLNYGYLMLRGPNGCITYCNLLSEPPNQLLTKIGNPWKEFCQIHGFQNGDTLRFNMINVKENNLAEVAKVIA